MKEFHFKHQETGKRAETCVERIQQNARILSSRSPKSRRGGFLTLGLILCLILILTVAAVIWNYQYLTIQNLELECAARSAIQAALADQSLAQDVNAAIVSDADNFTSSDTSKPSFSKTIDSVLKLTAAQQKSSASVPTMEMDAASKSEGTPEVSEEKTGNQTITTKIQTNSVALVFKQPRTLGFFKNVFGSSTREEIEGTESTGTTDTKKYFTQRFRVKVKVTEKTTEETTYEFDGFSKL